MSRESPGNFKELSNGRLDALNSAQTFDVCVIGSGFAGTVLAKSLVERGVRTVMLESGESRLQWFVDRQIKQLAAFETNGDACYPLTRIKARALGGNSNFWTGRTERLHPSDFEDNSYTSKGASWPVTYAEIEPYYEKAEKTLRVRGGPLSEHHPPRESDLPLPPSSDISSLKAMMAAAGVVVDDSPTATPTKEWRFFRVSKELLPSFIASPHALLISGLTVTRLIPDSDGRIVGAEARTMDGNTTVVRARLYVVACGGIESPRLLLLSRSETFPKGIGNTHDLVGRGFNEHPGVNFYAKIPHSWSTIYPRHKVGRSHQFYNQFKGEGLGGVLPVFIQSWIFPHHLMQTWIKDLLKTPVAILDRVRRAELYIGATIEMEPCDDNRVTLAEDVKDRFGNPLAKLTLNFTDADCRTLERTRELIRAIFVRVGAQDVKEAELTWSRHHIGTCRMGDNQKTSVVDRNLRVHECPNLYIGGCETFVTGSAVPPVLTITALSHRLADHLVIRLQQG